MNPTLRRDNGAIPAQPGSLKGCFSPTIREDAPPQPVDANKRSGRATRRELPKLSLGFGEAKIPVFELITKAHRLKRVGPCRAKSGHQFDASVHELSEPKVTGGAFLEVEGCHKCIQEPRAEGAQSTAFDGKI